MRVTMYSTKPYDIASFNALPANHHQFNYLDTHLNSSTAALAEGSDAVCCFVNDDISGKVIRALKKYHVKYIVLRSAGFNHVDLNAAEEERIRVCRVPEYSPYAVAEHSVALILALNRKLHRAHNRIRENDYSLNGLMGFDLHGKTVGLIGAGKIGLAFAKIMRGFGCKVLAVDPNPGVEIQKVSHIVELDTLWQDCDIISLHCPLTPETHHLINKQVIDQLKPGVMLINTSRGALMNAKALIAGLKSGKIGYLGLDVYEEEADLFFEDLSNVIIQDDVFARLTTFPNVLITGHQAFFTKEAMQRIAQVTLDNLNGIESDQWDLVQSIAIS